jgi:hypothetical protein
MSVRTLLTVCCDGGDLPADGNHFRLIRCDETFTHDGIQSNVEVRKAARKAGWKASDQDLCPRHKELYK